MVRLVLCAFAFGAWCLQQCATLPSLMVCVGLAMPAALILPGLTLARRQGKRRGGWGGLPVLRQCAVLALALAAGFGWAAWRAEHRLLAALPLALEQRELTVSGVVRGVPEPQAYGTRFVFQIVGSQPGLPLGLPRTVWLTWYLARPQAGQAPAAPVDLQPGQRWRLSVRLRRPHGNANEFGFDRERWMLERDLRAAGTVQLNRPPEYLGYRHDMGLAAALDTVDRLRVRLRRRIETVLAGEAHVGVVVALATGLQSAISQQDWQRFTRTGTNHLVAISGLHVSLVAGVCAWLAAWAWRNAARVGWPLPLLLPAQYVAALAGAVAGGVYIALAGFGVPAQRAWWMLLVAALTVVSGRDAGVATALAWALGMVVLADPWAVASPGLALSFAAVASVLLVADPRRTRRHFGTDRLAGALVRSWRYVQAALKLHGAVTIALLPLSIAWFSQAPVAGVPANLLAIPWISLGVTPLVLLGVLLPAPLDAWAYRAAHGLLGWLGTYFDVLTRPSWAVWRVPTPGPLALVLALAGAGWWLMPRGWPLRRYAIILFGPLLWPYRVAPAPGEFRVTVLDVGQGGATLIETATHQMLFDAGPGPESTNAGQRVVLPFLQSHGIARLDLLTISHADSDHAGGAPAVLDGIRVDSLRASLPPGQRLWGLAQAAGVSDLGLCRAGTHWSWDAVSFDVLWPASAPDLAAPNQTSCVLRVSNGAHAVLLTADIEAAAERALTGRIAALTPGSLAADVLLAPHHGSKTSSSGFLLDAIMPREVVFQVGYLNRFHHPHPAVVARYSALGATLLRSDADGEVRFETQGAQFDAMRYRVWHRRYWMGR
jgi:competence protein ComEC